VKVAGRWRYVYRAIDQFGQVVDVFVSRRRVANAARRFLGRARGGGKRESKGRWHAGGAAASGMAPHRLLGQQPGRGGSRPAEGASATDARA
jgi:hypothetical protein